MFAPAMTIGRRIDVSGACRKVGPSTTRATPLNRILLLHALRAAAALAVAVHHLSHEPFGAVAWPWLPGVPLNAGVDVFFTISGFVMVHASGRLFAAPGARRTFLVRRLARIVPLYWATTTVFLLVLAALPGGIRSPWPGGPAVLASYAFFPWPRGDGTIQPVYSLGWTLNYEMFFYAVFALFLPLRRFPAVAGIAVALTVIVFVGAAVRPVQPVLMFWTDPMVLEFALGMGLALLVARGTTLPWAVRLVLAVLGLAWLGSGGWNGIGLPAFAPGAVMLTAAAVLGPDPPLPPWLGAWPARLGDASYALYLVHPFALRAVTLVWVRLGFQGVPAAAAASAVAVTIAVCIALASYRLFEAPTTRWLTRRFARTSGQPAPGIS